MIFWTYAAFCLVCAGLWAYTRCVQAATLFWGLELGEGNDQLPSTGLQDALTPPRQVVRNVAMLASFVGLPVVGVTQLGWEAGLLGFMGAFVLASTLQALLPGADSSYFFRGIRADLSARRAKFAKAGDEKRVLAADELLAKLERAFRARHGESAA